MLNLHIYTDETYTLDIFCFRVIKLKLWPQLPFVSLVALNGADYSMCSWVSTAALLAIPVGLHRVRQWAAYLTPTSLMPAPYSRQILSRLENAADLSSPLTARREAGSAVVVSVISITAAWAVIKQL